MFNFHFRICYNINNKFGLNIQQRKKVDLNFVFALLSLTHSSPKNGVNNNMYKRRRRRRRKIRNKFVKKGNTPANNETKNEMIKAHSSFMLYNKLGKVENLFFFSILNKNYLNLQNYKVFMYIFFRN